MIFVTKGKLVHQTGMIDIDKYPFWEIGGRLKAIRKSTGLSATDFVKLLGIPYTRYINWETGARRLKPEDAELFCDLFSVSMDFIYRGKFSTLPENVMKQLSSMPRDNAQSRSKQTPDSSAK